MKAKLVNGNLIIFQQPDWLLGDSSQYAAESGFKEVLQKQGSGGIYETSEFIIIENSANSIISPVEFLGRFTQQELRGIFTAVKSNVDVEIWKEMFDKSLNIDLVDPLTLQGLQLIASLNLLAPERINEILSIA